MHSLDYLEYVHSLILSFYDPDIQSYDGLKKANFSKIVKDRKKRRPGASIKMRYFKIAIGTLLTGMTRKGPPAPLLINAINFGFTSQNNESHVISVT